MARAVIECLLHEGCTTELSETRQSGDARRFAAEAGGAGAVVCIGGDGTVNEVLNGLALPGGPPLAMIPCGTANVLAKELKLPRTPEGLARMIANGREARWDLGVDRVSGRKFLLFGSAGFDAHVVHVFHAARRGPIQMWQYLLWGLKCLTDHRPPRMSVEVDGRLVAEDASWVQVSNVASYGGPLVFTPRAVVDDGLFEVMILRSPHRRDTARMFAAALFNYFFRAEYPLVDVEFVKARRVALRSEERVPVQYDGDPGGHLPVDFEIVPGGIRILAP